MGAPSDALVFFGATGDLAYKESEALRDQKSNLLKAVWPIAPGDVVRGRSIGYRDVPGIRAG